MHRGGQTPRPANDIKHRKMAVVGLAGGFLTHIKHAPRVSLLMSLPLVADVQLVSLLSPHPRRGA
jgi:hypothetical protein